MIDPLSKAKEYGQGKKIEEMRSKVPIGSKDRFMSPPAHLIQQEQSMPLPAQEEDFNFEEEDLENMPQPDPMAGLPREQQNALYRAEMWKQIAETPGASDLALSYFEAAISDLKKYQGETNVEKRGADNELPEPRNPEDRPEEDRVSGQNKT